MLSSPFELTPEMWARPEKQGELKKQGHLVKNWKTRWFMIQNDGMFYFKVKNDPKPKGYIPLRSCVCKESNKFGKAYVIELSAPSINKVYYIQCYNQQDVKQWMAAIEAGSEYSSVSAPYNVQHEIHVDFDSATGFSGLPPEWEAMLKTSGITRDEALKNPEDTLRVLEFQSNFIKDDRASTHPPAKKPAPIPLPEDKPVTLQELISKEDPNAIYRSLEKIGEGAAGEVFMATNVRSNKKVAVKKMEINAENIKLLITEIGIMKTSSHENIVDYMDSYIVEDKQLWVVMEFMDGGCLTDILELFQDLKMNEPQIALCCR